MAIWLGLIESGALFGLIIWLMNVSYRMGVGAKQLENNTEMLRQFAAYGTPGTKERLQAIDDKLEDIVKRLERIENGRG